LAAVLCAVSGGFFVGAGIARVEPPRIAVDLTYETYPLTESGSLDRGSAPTRYWYKNQKSRIDNYTLKGGDPVLTSSFIMDCDSSRMIQVSWEERTVMITTFEDWQRAMEEMMRLASRYAGMVPGMDGDRDEPRENTTGGVVTSTTTWDDTTAQRDWFGLPGRYAEYTESTSASADACYPAESTVEHRVWTTPLDIPLCIPDLNFDMTAMPEVADGGGGCVDRHESRVVGTPREIDFLLRSETITTVDGRRRSSGYEVTDLSRETLADSLFQPPAGFERIELDDMFAGLSQAEGAMAGAAEPVEPKAAGIVRIGVALSAPPDMPADPSAVKRGIADWIETQAGYDAVPLVARDRAGALAEAPGVEADYVLFYDLEKAKAGVSAGGVLGGIVGGSLGARAAGGAMKLEVEGGYDLSAVPGGERVARDDIEEDKGTEDPQSDLTEILSDVAGEALEALR
jgi:hypothetical protein